MGIDLNGRSSRARRGRRTAGLILLFLGIGAAPVLAGTRAAELPVAAPGAEAAPSVPADLATRVAELTEHIHGMEGKLRESAAARRTADQARMEAERRLAEGTQETARLSAEIGLLRDAKTALEARLARAEEQNTRGTEQLAKEEEQVRRLTAEGETQVRHGEALEHQIEQLKEGQRQAEEGYQGRLRDTQAAQVQLSAKLTERAGELERVQADLTAVTAERDALASRLTALRASVPEGGALTLEEARAQSAAAAAALREALERAERSRDTQARQAAREAEQTLQRRQFAAARVAGARSVYRVRPSDTLAQISSRFYGDSAQWRAVYEANRHVLPDPNRLTPGMTLVIP